MKRTMTPEEELEVLRNQRDVLVDLLMHRFETRDDLEAFSRDLFLQGYVPARRISDTQKDDLRHNTRLMNAFIRLTWHVPTMKDGEAVTTDNVAEHVKRALEMARADGWAEAADAPDMAPAFRALLLARADQIRRQAALAFEVGDDLPRTRGEKLAARKRRK